MTGVLFRRKDIYPRYLIQRPIVHILEGGQKNSPLEGGLRIGGN